MLPAHVSPAAAAPVVARRNPGAGTPGATAWLRLMDTLLKGVAVFEVPSLTLIHTNVALRHLLGTERDPRLRKEVDRFARAVMGAANLDDIATGDVRTCAATYTLRGTYLQANPLGAGPTVLVAVHRTGENGPAGDQLQSRFGFTPSEAQLAALIADGKSNAQVATSLCISPHTARHHTERVFTKLGVRTRSEATCKLLQG